MDKQSVRVCVLRCARVCVGGTWGRKVFQTEEIAHLKALRPEDLKPR